MKLLKNYLYFIKLSAISLVISLFILNVSLEFFDTKKSLLITLIVVFLINFFNLINHYKFNNNYFFFIYSICTRIFFRVLEYNLFLFLFNILYSHNICWLITIFFTHFLKFFSIEIYKKFQLKN